MTNVAKAQAQLNFNNTERFPQINLQGAANRAKNSRQVNSSLLNSTINNNIVNNFSLASVLNYEIDLWGAAANADKAAQALISNKENRQAVRQSVTANMTVAYFNLLALTNTINKLFNCLTKRNIPIKSHFYLKGVSSAIDLSQAQSLLATNESELPILQ